MAQIPLSQIPNAPDLSSMAAPQVNNVSLSKVDFSGERAAVARGYESAKQDPRSAGLVGASVSEAGQGVYKAAKTLADKQQELNDNAAWAEFSTNYAVKREDFLQSLDQSRPETWRGADNEFQAKVANPAWQALPVSVQQKYYPSFLKLTSEDQVRLGHSAFQAKVAGDLVKQGTQVDFLLESGKYDDAKKALEGMRVGLSSEQYETKLSKINTEEQLGYVNKDIALRPDDWSAYLSDLYAKDEQIPESPNISKDQIPKLIQHANNVSKVQQDQNYGSISSDINSGNLKSFVDVEKDPRFQKIKDEKYKASLRDSIADRNLNTPQGDAYSKDAMLKVKGYPNTDDPATEAMEIRRYNNENVPSIFRDAINKALDSKIAEMASNNGRLKPETELIQYGVQRLSVARDGGVFGKFYSDADVKKDTSGVLAKANIEVMKLMEDVETTLRNSGVKTRAEADKVIETATAAGRAKQAAGDLGNQKGWLDFLNSKKAEVDRRPDFLKTGLSPQASNGGFTPIGDKSWSVTSYGYPGDTTPDKNSSAGIGAFTKHLTRDSFGTSYDVEEKLRQAGVKPGEKVNFKLSNGQVVTKVWHDRGATPEQARKMGLRNYYGRVDLYSPDSPHELAKQGVKVIAFKRYTENGQS